MNFAPFRQPQVVSVVRPLSLRYLLWTIAFFTLLPLPLSGAMLFQYYKHFFAIMFSFSLSFLEFYFVAWIAVSKSRFTLEFAERENEVYLALKKEVTEEV